VIAEDLTHTPLEALLRTLRIGSWRITFDMRGAWRPQAGKRPLDGRVRPQLRKRLDLLQ
jgi:hypothetical protein